MSVVFLPVFRGRFVRLDGEVVKIGCISVAVLSKGMELAKGKKDDDCLKERAKRTQSYGPSKNKSNFQCLAKSENRDRQTRTAAMAAKTGVIELFRSKSNYFMSKVSGIFLESKVTKPVVLGPLLSKAFVCPYKYEFTMTNTR